MFTKTPKSRFELLQKNIKRIFIFEIIALGVSYGVWKRMNTSQGT